MIATSATTMNGTPLHAMSSTSISPHARNAITVAAARQMIESDTSTLRTRQHDAMARLMPASSPARMSQSCGLAV
jgi:hypothetical protein